MNNFLLTDKVVLITGGGSGIGLGLGMACCFVQAGSKVVLVGRREDVLFNNAGAYLKKWALDTSDEEF